MLTNCPAPCCMFLALAVLVYPNETLPLGAEAAAEVAAAAGAGDDVAGYPSPPRPLFVFELG